MEVSRLRRFTAFLINLITLNGFLGIVQAYYLLNYSTSLGGWIVGYTYESSIELEGKTYTRNSLYSSWIIYVMMILFTAGIFWVYDIITMEKRKGPFYEVWAECFKTNIKKK